jgi:hypothetical protein
VMVKNDDNSNQKMEERRQHVGQMSMSIGIGRQVEPLP